MANLKVADFYYGAFLSILLNSGVKPSLFDDTPSRRIFDITTNKGDYLFYTKYLAKPLKYKEASKIKNWQFVFSEDEIEKIKELGKGIKKVFLALICSNGDMKDGEIAIVDYKTVRDCVGFDLGVKQYRLNIKSIKNTKGLKVYGSGRADKKNGVENTLLISRDIIKEM